MDNKILNVLNRLTNLEMTLLSLLFLVCFIYMINVLIKKKTTHKNKVKKKLPKLNDLIYKYDNQILNNHFLEICISLLFFLTGSSFVVLITVVMKTLGIISEINIDALSLLIFLSIPIFLILHVYALVENIKSDKRKRTTYIIFSNIYQKVQNTNNYDVRDWFGKVKLNYLKGKIKFTEETLIEILKLQHMTYLVDVFQSNEEEIGNMVEKQFKKTVDIVNSQNSINLTYPTKYTRKEETEKIKEILED